MRPEIMQIHGLTKEIELEYMQSLCSDLPEGKALEIGTFNGRSTAALCEAVGDRNVVTVDNFKMAHHGTNNAALAAANLKMLGYHPMILHSHSPISDDMIRNNAPMIALLFIDGYHHPDTVTQEMDRYTPYMPLDAVVCIHDYNDPKYVGYTEAIDAWFESNSCWKKLSVIGSLIAFNRVAYA